MWREQVTSKLILRWEKRYLALSQLKCICPHQITETYFREGGGLVAGRQDRRRKLSKQFLLCCNLKYILIFNVTFFYQLVYFLEAGQSYMLHRNSWLKLVESTRKHLAHFERFCESPKDSEAVWKRIKVFENIVFCALPNPEKSRDEIFKNPGIGISVQSRDPGISRDPAGACLAGVSEISAFLRKREPGACRELFMDLSFNIDSRWSPSKGVWFYQYIDWYWRIGRLQINLKKRTSSVYIEESYFWCS